MEESNSTEEIFVDSPLSHFNYEDWLSQNRKFEERYQEIQQLKESLEKERQLLSQKTRINSDTKDFIYSRNKDLVDDLKELKQEIDRIAKFHNQTDSDPLSDLFKDKDNEILMGSNRSSYHSAKSTAQSVSRDDTKQPDSSVPATLVKDSTLQTLPIPQSISNQNIETGFSGFGIGSNETLYKSNRPVNNVTLNSVVINKSEDTLAKKQSFSSASGSPQPATVQTSQANTETSDIVVKLPVERRNSILKSPALTSWSEQTGSETINRRTAGQRRRSSIAVDIVKDPRKHLSDVTKTLIELKLEQLERLMTNILRNIKEMPRVILPDPLDSHFAKDMELTSKLVLKLAREPVAMSTQDAATLLSQVIQNYRPLFPRHLITLIQSRSISYMSLEDLTQHMRAQSYLIWIVLSNHFRGFDSGHVSEWLADECHIFPRHLYESSFVNYKSVLKDLDAGMGTLSRSASDEEDDLATKVNKAVLCPDNVLLRAFLKLDNYDQNDNNNEDDVNERFKVKRAVADSLVILYDSVGEMSFLLNEAVDARLSGLSASNYGSEITVDDILNQNSLLGMIVEAFVQLSCNQFICDRKTVKRVLQTLMKSGELEFEVDPIRLPIMSGWPSAKPTGQFGNEKQATKNLLALCKLSERLLDTMEKNVNTKASQSLHMSLFILFESVKAKYGSSISFDQICMKVMTDCLLIPSLKLAIESDPTVSEEHRQISVKSVDIIHQLLTHSRLQSLQTTDSDLIPHDILLTVKHELPVINKRHLNLCNRIKQQLKPELVDEMDLIMHGLVNSNENSNRQGNGYWTADDQVRQCGRILKRVIQQHRNTVFNMSSSSSSMADNTHATSPLLEFLKQSLQVNSN